MRSLRCLAILRPELNMYTPKPRNSENLVPFSQMRQTIAEHLVYSGGTVPHFPIVGSIHAGRLVGFRKILVDSGKTPPPYDCLFLWALRECVPKTPLVNSHCFEKEIVVLGKKDKMPWFHYEHHADISVGISVNVVSPRSKEEGLIVPVLRNVEQMNFSEIVAAFQALVAKAQAGKCTRSDYEGGTIVLNNSGPIHSGFGISIIPPPYSTIVTFSRIAKDNTMTISISCDHRVYDGGVAGMFFGNLKKYIEEDFPNPGELGFEG